MTKTTKNGKNNKKKKLILQLYDPTWHGSVNFPINFRNTNIAIPVPACYCTCSQKLLCSVEEI